MDVHLVYNIMVRLPIYFNKAKVLDVSYESGLERDHGVSTKRYKRHHVTSQAWLKARELRVHFVFTPFASFKNIIMEAAFALLRLLVYGVTNAKRVRDGRW